MHRRQMRPSHGSSVEPTGLASGRYSVSQDDQAQRSTQKPQNTLSMCRGFFREFSRLSVGRRRFAVTESARTGYQRAPASESPPRIDRDDPERATPDVHAYHNVAVAV